MGAGVSIAANTNKSNAEFCDFLSTLVSTTFYSELPHNSRDFLYILWKNAPQALEQLLGRLKENYFVLTVEHVAKIDALLKQEDRLPKNILQQLGAYLDVHSEAAQAVEGIFSQQGMRLLEAAINNNYLHHSLPHAFEISIRVNRVLDHLGIFYSDVPVNHFLRALTTLMIQFHDLVQKSPEQKIIEKKIKGECLSSEEESAERITRWILAALGIANHSELSWLIKFIANRIIVLGTTVIFNKPPEMDASKSMDLSHLFLEFKQVAIQAEFLVAGDPDDLSSVPTTNAARHGRP